MDLRALVGADARRQRERSKRKASFKVIRTEEEEFAWTPATARGAVSHKAIELSIGWRGDPAPGELVDEGIAEQTGRKVDLDHPTSFDHGDDGRDPPPDQTGSHNSGPLGRRHDVRDERAHVGPLLCERFGHALVESLDEPLGVPVPGQ